MAECKVVKGTQWFFQNRLFMNWTDPTAT